MEMPTIQVYYPPSKHNAIYVTFGPLHVYFSYHTPVAFTVNYGRCIVRKNIWGTTTAKHLNHIDGGSKDAKRKRVSGPEFERLFKEHTEPLNTED